MLYWYLHRFCQYSIGRETSIAPTTLFTGNRLTIGNNTVINRQCYLDAREALCIGSNVSISNQVYIQTATHDAQDPLFKYVPGPVHIGDHAWIGARALILPGVAIGEGAVVGAGAVVTRNVEPYTIVAGVPARVIGQRAGNLRYQLNYFPFFDTDYAVSPGIQERTPECSHDIVLKVPSADLEWHSPDPVLDALPTGDRLRPGEESQRLFTRTPCPQEADSLGITFTLPGARDSDRLLVYLDWMNLDNQMEKLDVEIVGGGHAEIIRPVPKLAAELVVSIKGTEAELRRAITNLQVHWLARKKTSTGFRHNQRWHER
jgi:acetyltransferase-like isoleucine patch superfamily enzyme